MTCWIKIGCLATMSSVLWLNRCSSRSISLRLFRKCNFASSPSTVHVKLAHHDATSSSDSDSDVDEEIMDFYNESELFSIRHLLYPNSEDYHIKELNNSTAIQDVFTFIKTHESDMNGQLVSQSVLVLWDLQNIYYKVHAMNLHPSPIISALLNPHDVVRNYVIEVSGHEDFERLLNLVNKCCWELSVDELTAVLLYLNKMGVSLHHEAMQNIICRCEAMLGDAMEQFTLAALSRFTLTIHSKPGLWPVMISRKTLPYIMSSVETCDNASDLRLLTICLNSMRMLITKNLLSAYKLKVESFIDRSIITREHSRLVTKIVRFLNYPHWSSYNLNTMRKLMLVLKGSVTSIAPQDLIILHKVFQTQLEPADMMFEIHDAAAKFLSKVESATISNNPVALQGKTELLACLVTCSSPEQRTVLERLAHRHVEACSASTLPTLFKILRDLKTSDRQLCDAFWSKTLYHLQNIPSEREDYKLFRVAHRYMHFNNNLGGTYCHYELEKQMINWLWNEIENGVSGVIPSKFARAASFILAYGNIGQHRAVISEANFMKLLQKLQDMSPQFSRMDCLYISKGLKISSFIGRNKSQRFVEMLTQIDTELNNCAFRHLQEQDLKLSDVNKMVKCYINRRQAGETQLFHELVKRYEHLSGEITSRELRDGVSNLLITNCLLPGTLDRLVHYVVQVSEQLLGETVVKLLYTCYTLGYTPRRAQEFFQVAQSVIYRDRERMQGLVLLQAAIALCFFHQLPENLIHFIFTVEFLERLDEEVEKCYAKASYPMRVRHALMHLNRAVCLDYPEKDVPWFHEKYCQQTIISEPQLHNELHNSVLQCLVAVTGSEHFVHTKKYSPYYYRIDFQILLDKEQKPVSIKQQADADVSKIAVLLWSKDTFTNTVSQLCGEQQLKQRHLEMLGYRVVGISTSLWNSMYMSGIENKINYLHEKLGMTVHNM